MKKIAITQRLILNEDYYELREALDVRWGLLFKELGFLPIVLPIEINIKNYFNEIGIDGIVLTGGNDLYRINENAISKKRDMFENKIIHYAISENIPIFGICRGMQIIAQYFGAKFTKVYGQVAMRHNIRINKESKYFKYLNKLKNVNSYHDYAIESISSSFLVSAVTEYGMIKAIEHKKYKIFAHMWHTEREDPFDDNEMDMIKYFFNDLEGVI